MNERTPLPPARGLARGVELPSPPTRSSTPIEERRRAAVPRTDETKPESPKTRKAKPPSSRSTGGRRETTLSLPQGLAEQLRRAASQPGTSLAKEIVRSVVAVRDELAELVSRERPPKPTAVGEFQVLADPQSIERGETRVIVPLRMVAADLDALDRLVKSSKADSRSQMVTAALRAQFSASG